MCRKLVLIFFLALIQLAAKSQDTLKRQPVTLLYYIDETKYPPFFIPFIETYLKDLTYSNKELQLVYSRVISINALYENRKIEGKIIDAFIQVDRGQTILENSKPRDAYSAEIAKSLLNYDKFLIIKNHPFNSILEYQFLMYDVVKENNSQKKDIPVLKNYKSSSVFIDPTSANYKEELKYALKQVCSEVNETPKADIKVNGKTVKSLQDTVYIALKDTLRFEAITIDPDSPKERFTYFWSVNKESLYGQIIYGREKQTFIVDTPSVITVGLAISDGISQSERRSVTIAFIERPSIEFVNSGNAQFWDELGDLWSKDIKEIRDDLPKNTAFNCDYLYHQSVFGRKKLLWGEDSMTIYFSKGKIRLAQTTASDSILESSFVVREIYKDSIDTVSTFKNVTKKGKYAVFHLYPEKRLRIGQYIYTFYADEKGVKSTDLKVRLNFVRVRQFSLTNEYVFCWLGANKGLFGNALLGLNWQPFAYVGLSVYSSFPFLPSKQIKNEARDRIETGNINSRFTIELQNPDKYAASRLAIHIQQFNIINTDNITRKDYVWGIGWRQNLSFLSIGSKLDIISCYNYFPNFQKKSYISGVGMFEFSLGVNYHFFARKKVK